MTIRYGNGSQRQSMAGTRAFRMAPVAWATALALASATGVQAAPRAFSNSWFAAKQGVQQQAAQTGRLPDGSVAGLPRNGTQARVDQQVQRSVQNVGRMAALVAQRQAEQAAARQQAMQQAVDVPDGLGEGGLKVDANPLTAGWEGANSDIRTSQESGRTVVTVEQTEKKAILNWETFNIGRNTTLRFDQSKGRTSDGVNDWAVLNRINDPKARPSRIAGQIEAPGAVYVINRNGIVFHGSSQVNVRNLVASSLSLSNEQFRKGINTPSYIEMTGGGNFALPTFGDHPTERRTLFADLPDIDYGQAPGAVEVQAGAELQAHAGGKILVLAPKVRNAGRLSAPDGQVILAAGENVYLTTAPIRGDGQANEVRGLDVAVSAPLQRHLNFEYLSTAFYSDVNRSGAVWRFLDGMTERAQTVGYGVVNDGIVQSERGNIILQALDVTQNGVLQSSTALNNRNGSILLRAWGQGTQAYSSGLDRTALYSWDSGRLTLGQDSVIQLLPDASDVSEIELTALATRYTPGVVRLYGKLVDVQSHAGVLVPSGAIDIQAAENAFDILNPNQTLRTPGFAARMHIQDGAYLSVAGLTNVQVDMARNFVDAEFRINELRDSPLLRESWLRGQKVVIDRRANGVFDDGPMRGVQWVTDADGNPVAGNWVGTRLGDMTGWVGVGKTDLAEVSTAAGSISLVTKNGDLITRTGSVLDVSGGSVRYTDGWNTSTMLRGADGRIYAMDQALPDMRYVGVAGSYVREHERWGVTNSWKTSQFARPRREKGYTEGRSAGEIDIKAGGAIVLDGGIWAGVVASDRTLDQAAGQGGKLEVGGGSMSDTTWSPGHIIIGNDVRRLDQSFQADAPLEKAWLDRERQDENANTLNLEKHTYLSTDQLADSGLGEILLFATDASRIERDAVLDLFPGSRLFLGNVENSEITLAIDGTVRSAGGSLQFGGADTTLILGSGSQLSVAGQWRNVRRDGHQGSYWAIDGGTVGLGNRMLLAKSDDDMAWVQPVIDVSGGASVHVGAKGRDVLRSGDGGRLILQNIGTELMDLDLRGYAAGSGASLELTVNADVRLGGARPDDASTLWLPETLYADRGFRALHLLAPGRRVDVPRDVSLTQQVVSIDLMRPETSYRDLPSGAALSTQATLGVLPMREQLTRRTTELILEAKDILIDQGAELRVGLGGQVILGNRSGLVSSDSIEIRGRVQAPAGGIQIDSAWIALAEGGQLLARGASAVYVDETGRRVGQVRNGGVVSLIGGLALRPGSLIDVSGTSDTIDMRQGNVLRDRRQVTQLALPSAGGVIRLSGTSGVIEGQLRGEAGGPGAAAGSLDVGYVATAGGGGGSSPWEQVVASLAWMDPDCNGLGGGDDVCNGAIDGALGVDLAQVLTMYTGMTFDGPVILSSALPRYMENIQRFVVSETLQGPIGTPGPLDPAQFGLSDALLDIFRDNIFFSDIFREALAQPGSDQSLILRPSSLDAGLGGLALRVNEGGSVLLDNAHLRVSDALSVSGNLVQFGDADSSLAARAIFLSNGKAAAPARVADGALHGRLRLEADVLEVSGSQKTAKPENRVGTRFQGFEETAIRAATIRLGDQAGHHVGVDADGRLSLETDLLYPGPTATAVVRAGDAIHIERLGKGGGQPLSAGGTLTLQAPDITQNGVLHAPHGRIVLQASERLALGKDSITSVSGAGIVTLYGTLVNNEHWRDPAQPDLIQNDPNQGRLLAPPEKSILLQAPDVALAEGATVDISGGGDLHAWEFVPGPGGSHDVLADSGMHAILPGFSGLSPVPGTDSGERVWLTGVPGLEAGWYTLLPAHYALLPGAYAVRSTGRAWMESSGRPVSVTDGSMIVQGWGGNAHRDTRDGLGSAWQVMSGDVVRSYSEYNEAGANAYFSSDAFKLTRYRQTGHNVVTPRLPGDAGRVVFDAGRSLVLDGNLKAGAGDGGRGGMVDIAGEKIAIVSAGKASDDLTADGYLVLDARRLSNFGAGSLLIGGTRQSSERGLQLDVTASELVLRNDSSSSLQGPEILLAAADSLTIEAGSHVQASGRMVGDEAADLILAPQEAAQYNDMGTPLDPSDDELLVPERDWGALLRVSNGAAVGVVRSGVDTTQGGQVRIGEGATLMADGALLIDATQTTQMAASAQLFAQSLSVASGNIGFGGGEGLVLDTAALALLSNSRDVTLRSYGRFDFHQSLDFGAAGLASITLDGAALAGHGDVDVTLRGQQIRLVNRVGGNAGQVVTGGSRLTLLTDTLVLGEGDKTLQGFESVTLVGSRQITGQGTGALDAGQALLQLQSPVLTSQGAANQAVRTQGDLRIASLEGQEAAPDVDLSDSLGARLMLQGRNVDLDGHIAVLGGAMTARATQGDVIVGGRALLDVGGFAQAFFDQQEYVDAGEITLSAAGNVRVLQGGRLNLSALPGGGSAGTLSLETAQGGSVALDGQIRAHAGAGGQAGSFSLEIDALADFAAMNATLDEAGFTRSRQFRIRRGDVMLDGTMTVAELLLVADLGRVSVAGTVDARSQYGGQIRIVGGNGVTLLQGGRLLAGATDAVDELGSGRITLEAVGGQLDLQGGVMDVSGGEQGVVRLRAQRHADNSGLAITRLEAQLHGARQAILEGVRQYASTDGTVESVRSQAVSQAQAFAAQGGQILADLGASASAWQVMPGIEIVGDGDLALTQDWNLAHDFADARLGSLTLRAAGDLRIGAHLSDGFSAADRSGTLLDSPSWDLRLVAGADTASADTLALHSTAGATGTIHVGMADTDDSPETDNGAGKLVRTGTGDLTVRAAGDLRLAHKESVIYTAGRRDVDPTLGGLFSTARAGASYGLQGGHLDVQVGADIHAQPSGQRFVQWLNRQGKTKLENGEVLFGEYDTGDIEWVDGTFVPIMGAPEQTSWWIAHGAFQQGIGALGGGNVSVRAGGDLVNLLVALPTSMRVGGGRTAGEAKLVRQDNGGLLSVNAAGAILGGQYYVARGQGMIRAGETGVGHRVVADLPDYYYPAQAIFDVAPVLALGDATLSLRTAGDLRLQTVLDPLLVRDGNDGTQGYEVVDDRGTYISGFTDRTALRLVSAGGKVTLVNQGEFIYHDVTIESNHTNQRNLSGLGDNVYPAATRVVAMNGDLMLQGPLQVLARDFNDLALLSGGDLVFQPLEGIPFSGRERLELNAPSVVMSYALTDMLPSALVPWGGEAVNHRVMSSLTTILRNKAGADQGVYLAARANPTQLPLAGDLSPSVLYALGSIEGLNLQANEQTWVRAGKDIRGLDVKARNLRASDATWLDAGNDIVEVRPVLGNLEYVTHIEVRGPGEFLMTAGRDLYADILSVSTLGNQEGFDPNNRPEPLSRIAGLPEQGASITVMAGLNSRVDYDGFAHAYLDPANVSSMPDYLKAPVASAGALPIYLTDAVETRADGFSKTVRRGLVSFMQAMQGTWDPKTGAPLPGEPLTPQQAWEQFQALPVMAQQQFLRQIYLLELREAGRDQNEPGTGGLPRNGGYNRGYKAIETLFPGTDWYGSVAANQLKLRTMRGGDINVLTPGGGLQVAALGTQVEKGYGLVTLASGHINVFAHNNITVNRSRILSFVPEATRQGSDQILWASVGDIDAGRGAKTVRVPSAPEVRTDEDANTTVRERSDMSGSGIGTVGDGDVDMVAPQGTVNAGDAGVRVAGNLNIAALQVLNAANIEVKGESKGVPLAVVVNVGALTSASAAASAASGAAQESVQRSRREARQNLPSIITVQVLGFGSEPLSSAGTAVPVAPDSARRASASVAMRYDPASPVKIVGMGERVDADLWQRLSPAERELLRQGG